MTLKTLLLTLMVAGVVVFVGKNWPDIRGKLQEKRAHRKFDVAEIEALKTTERLKYLQEFKNIRAYAWPMEGVVLVLEGTVRTSNQITDLRQIIHREKFQTPIKWKVSVSTNTETVGDGSSP